MIKINPVIPIVGAVVGYGAAVAFKKGDWKSPLAIVAALAGAGVALAVSSYFITPNAPANALSQATSEGQTPAKGMTQAEADEIARQITEERGKRYITPPNPNPAVALISKLSDGGYSYNNGKAEKITGGKIVAQNTNATKPISNITDKSKTITNTGIGGGLV